MPSPDFCPHSIISNSTPSALFSVVLKQLYVIPYNVELMRSSLLELVEGTPYAGTLMRITLLELSAEELLLGLMLELVEGTPYAGTLMRITLLELSAEELLLGLMLELVEGTPYNGIELMRSSLLEVPTMELSVPGLLLELYSGDGAPSVPATDIESPQLLQKNAVSATANFSKCL